MDWTTPKRVVFNQYNTTFLGYNRAYAIAGTLLQAARLIDKYQTAFPEINFPIWVPTNTTYLRELAYHIFERYLLQQGSSPDNVESFIGKFFYWEERGLYERRELDNDRFSNSPIFAIDTSRSRLSPLVWMVMVLFTRKFTYSLSFS